MGRSIVVVQRTRAIVGWRVCIKGRTIYSTKEGVYSSKEGVYSSKEGVYGRKEGVYIREIQIYCGKGGL